MKFKRIAALLITAAFFLTAPARGYAAAPGVVTDVDSAEINAEDFAAEETIAAGALEVTAPCAILLEKSTGTVIYEKNADERREPASVTKIMTMLLAVEALESGRLTFEENITVSAYASSMAGTQVFLREGERMSVRDIMKSVVINSANDAAVALAEHLAGSEAAFAALMNERAAQLGMVNTHFTNASGLLDDAEHYTTARDVSLMSCELIKHDIIKEFTTIWMDSLRGGETMLANTNQLIRYFNGATGLKTGFTRRAGYCLSATAERDGVEYISVTLGDATSADRFESARVLLSFAFANYTTVSAEPDNVLAPIKVELGEKRYVQPEPVTHGMILVPRADSRNVTRTLEIKSRLIAPVHAEDEVGRLVIKSGDKVLGEVKILAGETSEKLSWGAIFMRFVGLLFTNPKD